MSFDLFAYKQLRDTVSDCEDRYDEIERRIRFPQKASLAEKRKQTFFILKNSAIFALTACLYSFSS